MGSTACSPSASWRPLTQSNYFLFVLSMSTTLLWISSPHLTYFTDGRSGLMPNESPVVVLLSEHRTMQWNQHRCRQWKRCFVNTQTCHSKRSLTQEVSGIAFTQDIDFSTNWRNFRSASPSYLKDGCTQTVKSVLPLAKRPNNFTSRTNSHENSLFSHKRHQKDSGIKS